MQETNTNDDKNPIQVADRLFLTIEQLAEHGSMGLMELSEAIGLHKSTMHRVLNSLIYMKYVKQDEETLKYSLTFKLVRLAGQMLANVDIIEEIRPYLKQIGNQIGETVHLVQREQLDAVYLLKVEPNTNRMYMGSRVGSRIPLYCSGVGKVITALLDDASCQALWEESDIRSITPNTITDFETFMTQIREIRKCGYAIDNEENEIGVRCVAVALPAYLGESRFAVSITGPVSRMDDQKIQEYTKILLNLKEKLSKII